MRHCVTFAVLSLLPSPLQWGDAGARTWFLTPWNRSPSTQPPTRPPSPTTGTSSRLLRQTNERSFQRDGGGEMHPLVIKSSCILPRLPIPQGSVCLLSTRGCQQVCKVDAAYLKRPFCSDSARIPFILWTWLLLRMWLFARDLEKSHSTSE